MYFLARIRGSSSDTKNDWSRAFVIGGLMLLGGHGAVVWTED
jgi:hypothetical protein